MFGRKGKSTTPEALRERDVRILDVREDHEWRAGHIDGALHIPIRQLTARLEELPTDEPIVVVCRSGRRSGKAAKALSGRGYDTANLEGGLQAWARAGLPLTAAGSGRGEVV